MAEKKLNKAPDQFIRMLKKAMAEHPEGLSLNQIARDADISPAYLSFLVNGKRAVPSNDAITRLAKVLNIPKDDLFKAAGRPSDQALEFFRREQAAPIMRSLAEVPAGQLAKVQKLIERFVNRQHSAKK